MFKSEFGQLLVEIECNYDRDSQGNIQRENSEIIELSLLHKHPNGPNKIYQTYVKPTLNRTLSSTCKTLTGLDQSVIDQAKSFPEVCQGALRCHKCAYEV